MKELTFFRSRPADITVACMTNADIVVIEKFIAINLQFGVGRIEIYYEGQFPEDDRRRLQSDAVSIIDADDRYCGRSFKGVVPKQIFLINRAYKSCRTKWMGICDIDEFFVADEPLADLLANVPVDKFILRAESHEAIWLQGENSDRPFSATHVRRPMSEDQFRAHAKELYSRQARLHRPAGLLSHKRGKYIIRKDTAQKLRLHFALPEGRFGPERQGQSLRLVHFDAICEPEWVRKMRGKHELHLRTPQKPGRRLEQVEAVGPLNEEQRHRLFDRLYRLSAKQLKCLESLDKIARLPITWSEMRDGVTNDTGEAIFE